MITAVQSTKARTGILEFPACALVEDLDGSDGALTRSKVTIYMRKNALQRGQVRRP